MFHGYGICRWDQAGIRVNNLILPWKMVGSAKPENVRLKDLAGFGVFSGFHEATLAGFWPLAKMLK